MDVEQHRHLGAKAEVLRRPAHVERDGRLAFARVAAVDERQRVFHFEAAQVRRHRRTREHLHVEELIRVGGLHLRFAQRLALHPLRAERRHARIDLSRLRTGDAQLLRDRAEVDDLDDDRRVAALLKHGLRRAAPHLDARLGVQFHDEQRVFIEQLLQAIAVRFRAASASDFLTSAGSERAQEIERLHQPRHVRGQRLRRDGNDRLRFGSASGLDGQRAKRR